MYIHIYESIKAMINLLRQNSDVYTKLILDDVFKFVYNVLYLIQNSLSSKSAKFALKKKKENIGTNINIAIFNAFTVIN